MFTAGVIARFVILGKTPCWKWKRRITGVFYVEWYRSYSYEPKRRWKKTYKCHWTNALSVLQNMKGEIYLLQNRLFLFGRNSPKLIFKPSIFDICHPYCKIPTAQETNQNSVAFSSRNSFRITSVGSKTMKNKCYQYQDQD